MAVFTESMTAGTAGVWAEKEQDGAVQQDLTLLRMLNIN